MSAEAIVPDAVISAKERNQLDASSRRHSRESGNPVSFARYPEYKDSGIEWLDEVPAHWEVARLRWLSQRYAGGTPSKDREDFWSDGTIPWLNSGAVNDALITEPSAYITQEAFERSSARWIPEGALVMALAGQGKTKGTVAQVGFRTTCNQSMAAIVPVRNVAPRFLYWWLQSNYQNIRNMGGGDLRDGLNLELLGDIPCPMCDQREQGAIATFLDRETGKIDALIAEQEKLITLLKEKRQALISHAVTKGLDPNAPMKDSGIEWLGQVPAHWDVLRVKRDIAFITSGSRGWAEHYADDGDLFLRIGNLTRETIDLDLTDLQRVSVPQGAEGARTKVVLGDVLFSITAYLGSVAVAPVGLEPAYVSQHIALVRLHQHRLLPRWVGYVTLSVIGKTYLEAQAYGGTKIQLGLDDIANLPVTAPSLEEQAAIIEFLDDAVAKLDGLVGQVEATIDLLKERRAALISAAVTGKIDLRGVVAAVD